jgi:hypothetical protein
LQFAIAGANSTIAIAGVSECVLHNTLQELSGRGVIAGAKSLNEVLHKLISLSMINK